MTRNARCAECGQSVGTNHRDRIVMHTTEGNSRKAPDVCRGSGGPPLMNGHRPRSAG